MIESKLSQAPANVDKILPFFDRSIIMLCRMWANNTYHNEMAKNLIASLPKRIKKDKNYNDLDYRNHNIKVGDALIYNNSIGNSTNYILFVKNILQCDVRLYNTSNKAFNLSNIAVAHLHIGFYENGKFTTYNFGLLELKILVMYLNFFVKMPMFHAIFAESCLPNVLMNNNPKFNIDDYIIVNITNRFEGYITNIEQKNGTYIYHLSGYSYSEYRNVYQEDNRTYPESELYKRIKIGDFLKGKEHQRADFRELFSKKNFKLTKENVSLPHHTINGVSHSNFQKGDILKACGEFDGTLWKVLETKKSGNLLVSAISGNLHFTEQLSKEYAEYFEHAKLQHLELVASK